MSTAWARLVPKLQELTDLSSASRLLEWDQAVMMPGKGARARARTIATLEAAAHRRLIDPVIGEILNQLELDDSLDEDQSASLRVLRRDYEKARKVPWELVRAIAEARGHAYHAWTQARPASDFSLLEPHLARVVALKKEEADAIGWDEERYDALLDNYEPGMKTSEVSVMFDELVSGLHPIVDAVLGAEGRSPDFLLETYDREKQAAFCRWLVESLGFDMNGGRLDTSPHPFTVHIAAGDVRQTTRADPKDVLMSVYAAVHETGHALYEQGLPEELLDLPSGRFPSLGMHESQSRLWENQVARSRPYTEFLLPHLKERFPDEMGLVPPDDFYRAVNRAQRTLIRVTADELTYNLHVAFRFEIEVALFRDDLAVGDLPHAWNEGIEKYVGIIPDDDADGVLQDMHWPIGALGYFPTYTLGNLYAGAFWRAARADLGSLDEELRAGDTKRLLEWLRHKIHAHGYRYSAKDLAQRVVRGPITSAPLLDYLRDKYRDLYSVSI